MGIHVEASVEASVEPGRGELLAELASCRAERDALQALVRQLDRVDAIGQQCCGVAHDINNILTVIVGGVEIVAASADPEAAAAAGEILDACGRAGLLMRQLLAFARREPALPRVIQPADVVDEIARMVQRVLGQQVHLEVRVNANVPAVLGDATQLGQVVMNLVINARDAMPAGGRIEIDVARAQVRAGDDAHRHGVRPDAYAVITVRDNGSGIDDASLAAMWQPFFTTKPAGKGTGLGLAIVRGVIEEHRGFIVVSSVPASRTSLDADPDPGAGTTFSVYLPATDRLPSVRMTKLPRPGAAPTPTADRTVLLVEADPVLRRFAARSLRALPCIVVEAADADEALGLARSSQRIDLLVTDVEVGTSTGAALAATILRDRRGIDVLFTSGYDPARAAELGVDLETAALLTKPYDVPTLTARVRALLDQR